MSKVILMALLVFIGGCVQPMFANSDGWVKLGVYEARSATVYAHPASILTNGNIVQMWSIFDFSNPNVLGSTGIQYLSAKSLYEYDCAERKTKLLDATMHSGNMGDGVVVRSFSSEEKALEEWKSVPPGSVSERLWTYPFPPPIRL